MKLTSLVLFLTLLTAPAWAQSGFVGTCDQYQPGIGGDYCLNNGSSTMWQKFSGDVVNTRGVPQCSPTNISQCGKMTVQGLDGIPFFGTLTPALPLWCLNGAGTEMIPCAAGGIITHILSGTTPVFMVNSTNVPAIDVQNETIPANLSAITTPCAMADGEILQARFTQPPGGNHYTIPGSFTACTGTVVMTSGCPSMPSMPTGTGHAVLFDMIFNLGFNELDVVSCPTTGS
jgi:hypothetical protein